MIDDEGTQVVAARLPFGWPADSGVTADIIEAAMELAIDTARHATAPFGAALLDVTTLRAFSGGNTYFESGDRFAHAETNVLRAAMSTLPELSNHVLISTAEPCPMCAAASVLSGVRAIIFGTSIETLIQCGWFQSASALRMWWRPPLVPRVHRCIAVSSATRRTCCTGTPKTDEQ